MQFALPARRLNKGHHAACPVEEAPAVFAAIMAKRHEGTGAAALAATILGAQRSGETRKLEWDDVDLKTKTITISAEKMKARRGHEVAISTVYADLLREQQRWVGVRALVFPGHGFRPLSDMTLSGVLRRLDVPYTPHGLRATFSTWAAQGDWPRELAEHALAHGVGSAVERAYQRSMLLEQRRPLMEAWAQ